MKKTRTLVAIMMSMIMVLSMIVPVSAATHELFIQNDAENHKYDAYQIFKGDLSTDETTLSNVEWGDSIKDAEALITALTTDTKEIKIVLPGGEPGVTTLKDVFLSLTSETNQKLTVEQKATVVAEILGTVSHDSTTLDRFAELVGEVVYDSDGTFKEHKYLTDTPMGTSGDQTTKDGVLGYNISGLPSGYYLIKDNDVASAPEDNEGDFYTQYIVRVVKTDTLKVKGEKVKVTKSVNDTIGGTFEEREDANTNDTIYFKWEGTVPSNISSYDEYNYKFIDKMSAGLTFVQYEQIYIENGNGTIAEVLYNIHQHQDNEQNALPIKSQWPSGVVKTAPTLTQEDGKDYNVFTLEFEDLLKLYPNLLPSQKIIVKYSAYLNRDANLDSANVNEVKLEYDNNPNGEGTGTTVDDKAYVFTFQISIDKYDAANSATKLKGVEFLLYEQTGEGSNIVNHYAKVITEEMVEKKETVNGKVVLTEDVGTVYGFTTDRAEASILDTDENGAIALKGLDQGYYYLEEIKTNDGYNLLNTPVQVEITPSYTTDTNGEVTVSMAYKVDGRDSSSTIGVRNSKGSTLPSTGGMGTTVLYIAGGALVLCAIVLLITKKRMAAKK